MPRAIERRPGPAGLGSPSTTLRRSATTGSGRSRPQLTPARWASALFAPQTKSATAAQAIAAGADYLVVGRPIRDAADPAATFDAMVREVESAV